jgi:hypothetical protein
MESAPTVDSPHVAFASPTTCNSRVDTNQPEIQPTASLLPTPAAILSNHHPMLTREKNGIRKPRVLCASNYPLPQSFVALPPPYPMNLQRSQLPAKILIGFLQ